MKSQITREYLAIGFQYSPVGNRQMKDIKCGNDLLHSLIARG